MGHELNKNEQLGEGETFMIVASSKFDEDLAANLRFIQLSCRR